jgi:hypothetical protein
VGVYVLIVFYDSQALLGHALISKTVRFPGKPIISEHMSRCKIIIDRQGTCDNSPVAMCLAALHDDTIEYGLQRHATRISSEIHKQIYENLPGAIDPF